MNVELSGICKRFGSVVANDDVSLEIRAGEVSALLGENGAGKSTLMKVLYGHERADAGSITIDGQLREIDSPRTARALGIGMVFQQGSAIGALSVAENLLLGGEGVSFWRPVQRRRRNPALDRALAQLHELAPGIDPKRKVSELSAGERQLLELAKLLWRGARLLILDEPTSLLARPDAERLWSHLRMLAQRGRAVIMITHKLEDVANAADRVVVMRAGRVVHDAREIPGRAELVRAMLGGDEDGIAGFTGTGSEPLGQALDVAQLSPATASEPVEAVTASRLVVSQLSASVGSERVDAVSVSVGRGEILGIAGVTGNGQELFARLIAGAAAADAGRISLDGVALDPERREVRESIAYIPEQPRLNACAPELSVLVNLRALELARFPWWLDLAAYRQRARALLERFDVRPRDVDRAAGTLSGGNLQKLVLARELSGEPRLVVACFPALGLDFAATDQLQRELIAQAARGAAVVWISEDLEPLLQHADRIAVLHRGRLQGPVPRREASVSRLGAWMTGAEA